MKKLKKSLKSLLIYIFIIEFITFMLPANISFSDSANNDRIIFFNTLSSDCILVESQGKYGLIDTSNRKATYTEVDEDQVTRQKSEIIDYDGEIIKLSSKDGLTSSTNMANGEDIANYIKNVMHIDHLDFIIATHAHSDHIGGLEEIAKSGLVTQETSLFYKTYSHNNASKDDDLPKDTLMSFDANGKVEFYSAINNTIKENVEKVDREDNGYWHNQAFLYAGVTEFAKHSKNIIDISSRIVLNNDVSQSKVPDITKIENKFSSVQFSQGDKNNYYDDYISFQFGNYNIKLFNLYINTKLYSTDNGNSIVTLITKGNKKFVSWGDMNVENQGEQKIAKAINDLVGTVDIVKTGHHGSHSHSNVLETYDLLKPKYIVNTRSIVAYNQGKSLYQYYTNQKYGTTIYETALSNDGICVSFKNDSNNGLEFNNITSNNNNFQLADISICINNKPCTNGWLVSFRNTSNMYTPDGVDCAYADNTGTLVTGWKKIDNRWYYFDDKNDSLMKTGWFTQYNAEWYYLSEKRIMSGENILWEYGEMLKGWQKLDYKNTNNWYYFAPTGGTIKKNETSYYKEGEMVEGWQNIEYGGKLYRFYFYKKTNNDEIKGAMATGRRYINEDGNGGNYYYFAINSADVEGYCTGAMVSNKTIDGYIYDESGKCINNDKGVILETTVTNSINTPTNQNVSVTITTNKEIQPVEGWTLSTGKTILTKEYTENKQETVIIKDLYGNSTEARVNVNNIDKVNPRLAVNYNPSQATNKNVTVTVTSNEKIQPISGWNLSEDGKILTKNYTKNETETITVSDLAGNRVAVEIVVNSIDKNLPNAKIVYSELNQTNKNVLVTIDVDKEIQEISGWNLSSDKKKLTKEFTENNTETVIIKDLYGNNIEAKVNVNNIDKINPRLAVNYNPNQVTNMNVTVTVTSNEKIQPILGWNLSEDGKILTKNYTKNETETITVSDLAGNRVPVEIVVNSIDKNLPNAKIVYSELNKTNKNVLVTIDVDKEIQEISGWNLSSNKKKLTKEYIENKNETLVIKDLYGNTSEIKINVNNIDRINPNVTVRYNTTQITNKSVEVVISSDEQVQPISGWNLSEDGKILTKNYTKNETETITVSDLAENRIPVEIVVKNIDKNLPNAKIVYSELNQTNKNVLVTIDVDKEIQEISGWNLSSDKKKLSKEYTENGKEVVIIKDLDGNTIHAIVEVNNIDKKPPELNIVYSTKEFTYEKITVEIKINEKIQIPYGWILNEKEDIIYKQYDTNVEEELAIKDLAGNETKIKIKIDNIVNEAAENKNTESNSILPNAGTKENIVFVILSLVILILAMISYRKYKKYKKIIQ